MAPPKQAKLDVSLFPDAPWAKQLVEAFNQLSLQTTDALAALGPKFKTIKFTTGAATADSFPIDIPVESILKTLSIAQVVRGSGLGVPTWTMLPRSRSGALLARVSSIPGLAASTAYEIKLALE